jgi:hypothetical protein
MQPQTPYSHLQLYVIVALLQLLTFNALCTHLGQLDCAQQLRCARIIATTAAVLCGTKTACHSHLQLYDVASLLQLLLPGCFGSA